MSYEDLTVGDPNRIKRFLHKRRYKQAVDKMGALESGAEILDFGAGNGELAHVLLDAHSDLNLILYEPSSNLQEEVRRNVAPYGSRVEVVGRFEELQGRVFSNIFCLSVLEHLPAAEIEEALIRLHDMADAKTATLVEVPNELFLSALLKGALRHIRRPDDFDGSLKNIWHASIGRPPAERPLIDPTGIVELPWHGHHMGFDHRALRQQLANSGLFNVIRESYAPVNVLGSIASLDVYYSLTKVSS